MIHRHRLLGLTLLMLGPGMAGCSSHAERRAEPQAVHQAGSSAVRLAPDPAVVTSQLAVVVDVPFADPDRCVYHWRSNSLALAGETGPVLSPDKFKKGDIVAVDVEVPGHGEGEATRTLSAEVRVVNAPPVLRSMQLDVDRASGGSDLEVTAECVDPDHDETTVAYRWFKNGHPIEGASGTRLPAAALARGDRITVEGVVSDGEAQSESRRSNEFVIANRAPQFSAQPTSVPADEGTFRYQAMAADPDGDPLHFEVVQGPQGMTITPTGAIQWTVPAATGRQPEYPVTIRATDAKGGEATQVFTIRLTPRPKEKKS